MKKEKEERHINPGSVGSAINSARSCYHDHRSADHPFIEALEIWINSKGHKDDVYRNVDLGHLHKSPSSGRFFIQLLHS